MNWKKIGLSSLAVALLGLGVARGQGPDLGKTLSGMPLPQALPNAPTDSGLLPPSIGPGPQHSLSKWIIGERCAACCGPIGLDGPIGSEVYLRGGISFPIGGGALNNSLRNGIDTEAGVRSLFFNRDLDAAWTIGIGITNIYNPGSHNSNTITLTNLSLPTTDATGANTNVNVPSLDVTPSSLNRTSVDLALGREVWLLGTAESSRNDLNWRAGWDVGGRWGSEKLELDQIRHRTAGFGGVFAAIHTDVEVPLGNSIFQAGIRLEYDYNWSDIVQEQNNGDTQEINLMATLGIRF